MVDRGGLFEMGGSVKRGLHRPTALLKRTVDFEWVVG